MVEEKEILTILSKKEYQEVSNNLKKILGKPQVQKRISLQCDNYEQVDIDTRIRITNGEAELMQKVGDWKNIAKGKARTEISIPLQNDPNVIAKLYRIIKNLVLREKVENIIMQYESQVWKRKDFEIKLAHQFGRNDGYNCEVEIFNHKIDPIDIANQYMIPFHAPDQTPDFWRKWNKKINLFAEELTDKELLMLIKKYV